MYVKFTSGPEELSVPGQPEPVKRDQTVEVDDDLGKQLVKQGWERASHRQAKGGV